MISGVCAAGLNCAYTISTGMCGRNGEAKEATGDATPRKEDRSSGQSFVNGSNVVMGRHRILMALGKYPDSASPPVAVLLGTQ